MQRWRRGKTPPPPLNAIAADGSLTCDLYKDSIYAKHYLGLVQVGDDAFALVFASRENLAKLGSHTKLVLCDGTFKTAPSTSDNDHFYQNLVLHAEYKAHVLPFMLAIMTGKSRVLYDATFLKMLFTASCKLMVTITPQCPLECQSWDQTSKFLGFAREGMGNV